MSWARTNDAETKSGKEEKQMNHGQESCVGCRLVRDGGKQTIPIDKTKSNQIKISLSELSESNLIASESDVILIRESDISDDRMNRQKRKG